MSMFIVELKEVNKVVRALADNRELIDAPNGFEAWCVGVHDCVHAFQGRMNRFRRASCSGCAGVPARENVGESSGSAFTAASRSARMA